MLERVEIGLDHDRVRRVIRGFHLGDAREAVRLALRTPLEADVTGENERRRLISPASPAWFGAVARQAVPSFRPEPSPVATGERPP
jgi:hypothetical protein